MRMDVKNQKKKKEHVDLTSFIPKNVKGIKKLDKDLFTVHADFPAIKCDAKSCGKIQSSLRHQLFNRPNFRRVLSSEKYGPEVKLNLLHPSVKSFEDLTDCQRKVLLDENAEFVTHSLILTYNNFTMDEILHNVLPEEIDEIVTSFETIGHIAHINLKEHLLDFKHIIGEVLLDKNPNIKTVVNKTNSIEETYRFFKMELLAGEDRMFTTVQEHGCVFEFDYSKVYWNSRLQTEHHRIVNKLKSGDQVFDVFAGVGPFAIPAGKKGCEVFANDLNEVSYKALQHNAKLNKVLDHVKTLNLDGKEFLETIVLAELSSNHCRIKHIIMNLPAIAPQFLQVFREKYHKFSMPLGKCNNIIVHCYLFSKSKTPQVDAEAIVSNAVGFDVSVDSETHFVRRVAPNKVMMCVSFKLMWFEVSAEKCWCSSGSRKRTVEGVPAEIPDAKVKR